MEIRERQLERVVILDVEGRLVLGVEDRLKDKVNSLLLQRRQEILLNLRDVSQLDTSGLAAITSIRGAVERHGGRIKLLDLPKRVHDLLVVTRLITLFEVFESEQEAVNSFGEQAAV
jgi:anti-sigma B factor antagonist